MRPPATCHPNRPLHGHGQCQRCYNRSYRALEREMRRRADGARLVPAGPVAAHVAALRRYGSTRVIAALAGVSQSVVVELPRRGMLRPAVARALLAVTPASVVAASGVGVVRRVQALAALGWPATEVARLAGLSPAEAARLAVSDPSGRVHPRVAAAVAATYARLHMTPGPSARARARADALGWAPPLAWDDIDDPEQTPTGRRAGDPRRG